MLVENLFSTPGTRANTNTRPNESTAAPGEVAYGSQFMPSQALQTKDELEYELKALQALHLAGFVQEVHYEARKMELLRLKKFSSSVSVRQTEYTHLMSSANIVTQYVIGYQVLS